ncbi:metalloendopeptidase [Coemansia sp. RSA 1200]|nr:metalloendopeptidase [Coemansia sp. RSA 1200]
MAQLQTEDRRLVDKTIQLFHNCGHGLEQGKAEIFNQITFRLNELELLHRRNMVEMVNNMWFTPIELDGLPEAFFEGRLMRTSKRGTQLMVTTDSPDYGDVMQYARNSETRKQMMFAYNIRCKENVAILQETVDLRRKRAQLFGYRSHAAFMLRSQMAQTPDVALSTLSRVKDAVAENHKTRINTLAKLKRKHMDAARVPYTGFFDWDLSYYGRIYSQATYSYDTEEIMKYFPVPHVIRSILKIFQRMLGLQIFKLNCSDEDTWHPDVEVFEVCEADDEAKLVGYFYVDLYKREGKYNSITQFPICDGYANPDGTRQVPVSALMANFPPKSPDPAKPTLLSHGSVKTLMHEIGHVFHHLCARTKWSVLHYGQLERDFVETPSKMLEQWCWQPRILQKISAHYITGHPLSEEKAERVIEVSRYNTQSTYMDNMFLGLYDMAIHDSSSQIDVLQTFVTMSREIQLSNTAGHYGWPTRLGNIAHLMSGYDARYYSYVWSEVHSVDMFATRFAQEGLENPETGLDYRREILQPGAGRPAHIGLERFLGRKPNTTAFTKQLNAHK